MNMILYKNLMTPAWTNLTNLGVYPMLPTNTTAALREQLQLQHDKGWRIYEDTGTMYEALKNQSIDTAKYTYLKELKNKYTNILEVTCCNLLNRVLDRYGKIAPAYIEDNNQRMNEPIDSSLRIEKYFERIYY